MTGAIWTVMTQVSHVQEDCQRPPTGDVDDYFRWQIESALDYSVGSEVVPKLTASLSLQSMHHVMPSVCGCHFHRLYPEYAEICARHGVRLNTRKDVSAASSPTCAAGSRQQLVSASGTGEVHELHQINALSIRKEHDTE